MVKPSWRDTASVAFLLAVVLMGITMLSAQIENHNLRERNERTILLLKQEVAAGAADRDAAAEQRRILVTDQKRIIQQYNALVKEERDLLKWLDDRGFAVPKSLRQVAQQGAIALTPNQPGKSDIPRQQPQK